MDKRLLKEKLNFWKKQEIQLEKRFNELMLLRGEAAREGDLKENAGYELRTEEAQVASAQLGNARKTIKKLEEEFNASY